MCDIRGERIGRCSASGLGKRWRSLRSPISICRSIWTRQHDLVAVEVTNPDLPMVRASTSIGRVAVARHDDLSAQRLGPCDASVDVVYLEPEEQSVSRRHVVRIADASVVMFFFPSVKLKNQLAGVDKAFVVRPAVSALAVEQPLIPPAARLFNGCGRIRSSLRTALPATRSARPTLSNRPGAS